MSRLSKSPNYGAAAVESYSPLKSAEPILSLAAANIFLLPLSPRLLLVEECVRFACVVRIPCLRSPWYTVGTR